MKVDMSPPAVTARLMLLNQLWELSIKLVRAEQHQEPEAKKTEAAVLSERSLAEDWMTPEEDAASQPLADLPPR